MRRAISSMLAAAVIVSLVLAPGVFAQATKDTKSGLDRVEGTVQGIDKDKSTIRVAQRNRANVVWTVTYGKDTAFTYKNTDSNVDELKVGRRVVLLGKFEDEKNNKMTAVRVEIRTGK